MIVTITRAGTTIGGRATMIITASGTTTTIARCIMPPTGQAGGFDVALAPDTGCTPGDGVFLSPMDAELENGTRLGEAPTLDTFLADVQRKAYHVAHGALWDRETALDVVQESMLRFVEYYRDKPASAWPALFRSVLNSRINDERRKRLLAGAKRKLISLTGLRLGEVDADEHMKEAELPGIARSTGVSDPESGVISGELRQVVEQAVGTLPERQRQVFLLREQLGLSIRQTADTLGCSANSIKQHHFRALRSLRAELAEVWEHE